MVANTFRDHVVRRLIFKTVTILQEELDTNVANEKLCWHDDLFTCFLQCSVQIVSVFFGHFSWHFLTAEIGNFIQFENSVAPHPAESKRQAITYISYLFAFFDLQVRRPAQLAWTLPFSLFEVLVEIRRNKWTLDYFKSICEKLRGIIFSFMQGNTSLLKGVCRTICFWISLVIELISVSYTHLTLPTKLEV